MKLNESQSGPRPKSCGIHICSGQLQLNRTAMQPRNGLYKKMPHNKVWPRAAVISFCYHDRSGPLIAPIVALAVHTRVNHQDVLLTFHPSCTPPPAQRQTISLASVKPEPLFKTTHVEHIPFQHEWSTNHRQKNAIRCFSDHLDSTCTSAAANIIAQCDRLSCCPQLA